MDRSVTTAGVPATERLHPRPRAKVQRRLVFAGVLLVLVAAAAAAYLVLRARTATSYVTAPVTRGDLTQSVTASGTVNAQNTVLVGTQVSGTIQTIYVDYNSRVRRGQILARLDPSQIQAQVTQAQAALAQARAQAAAALAQAQSSRSGVGAATSSAQAQGASARAAAAGIAAANANVAKAQSEQRLAQQTLARDRALLAQGYIPPSQYDADFAGARSADTLLAAARAAAQQARAQSAAAGSQSAAGWAQAAQSRAQASGSASGVQAALAAVESAQAVLEQDHVNLQRTIITSPVDGTVVARNVSVGQTVAASFQTPTLFTIAQDLQKMEVDIGVGEPDIGNVRPGDEVGFSVLAYPAQIFRGRVSQVRVNPTTVQNVVTYTVIVLVPNRDLRLLPGMTANASIAVTTRKDALIVPTQALAYRPQSAGRTHGASGATAASPWGTAGPGTAGAIVAGSRGVLYVVREKKPQAVPVHVDLVSGTQAAVTPLRGSLRSGDAVVTSDSAGSRSRSAAAGAPPGMGRVLH